MASRNHCCGTLLGHSKGKIETGLVTGYRIQVIYFEVVLSISQACFASSQSFSHRSVLVGM